MQHVSLIGNRRQVRTRTNLFRYTGNVIGTFLVLFFVPETKGLSLEELDQVFSVPTAKHASYHLKGLSYNFRKYILRQKLPARDPLYHWETGY